MKEDKRIIEKLHAQQPQLERPSERNTKQRRAKHYKTTTIITTNKYKQRIVLEMRENVFPRALKPMRRQTSSMQHMQKKWATSPRCAESKNNPSPIRRRNQTKGSQQRSQRQGARQLRVLKIQKKLIVDEQNDQVETESVDPESALY